MEKSGDKRSVCLLSGPGNTREHPWTHNGAGLKSDPSTLQAVNEKTSIIQSCRLYSGLSGGPQTHWKTCP